MLMRPKKSSGIGLERKERKGFALQMSVQTLEIAQKVKFKVTALWRNLSL